MGFMQRENMWEMGVCLVGDGEADGHDSVQ